MWITDKLEKFKDIPCNKRGFLAVFALLVFFAGVSILTSLDNDKIKKQCTQQQEFIDVFWSVGVDLQAQYDDCQSRNDILLSEIIDLRKKIRVLTNGKPVVFTAYNALPWQTDDDPTITASGSEVYEGSVALSRDMIKSFNPAADVAWGDTVWTIIPFVVEDTMHKRMRRRVDVFMDDLGTARAFGLRRGKISLEG